MELVPWRFFGRELSPFRSEKDDLWRRFFGETPYARRFEEEWVPTVDISENKDNFIIKADLPGMEEKKKEEEEKDEHHYRCERCYGSFQRSFQLPTGVKADKVDATFDKGVLKVTIPKIEEAKKKDVEIKVKKAK
jgi:HSP20 family protein